MNGPSALQRNKNTIKCFKHRRNRIPEAAGRKHIALEKGSWQLNRHKGRALLLANTCNSPGKRAISLDGTYSTRHCEDEIDQVEVFRAHSERCACIGGPCDWYAAAAALLTVLIFVC